MRRVALTFVAALAATAVIAPPALAQYSGPGGAYRSYHRPAHAGMHRTYRAPAFRYRTGYRSARVGWSRPWPAYRTAYRPRYAVHRAYRARPYGVGVATVASALYGTAYSVPYQGSYYGSAYYGSPYYGSVYSGGGLVAYPYPTYAGYAGYGGYAYGGHAYGGCYRSCQPVVYYRSCGGCSGW